MNNIKTKKLIVEDLINFLKNFPKNAIVRAYEGEFCGIIIESNGIHIRELGCISNNGETNVQHY